MGIFDKAKEMISEHEDEVEKAIDKVADVGRGQGPRSARRQGRAGRREGQGLRREARFGREAKRVGRSRARSDAHRAAVPARRLPRRSSTPTVVDVARRRASRSTAPRSTRPAAASRTTPARSTGCAVVDVRKEGDARLAHARRRPLPAVGDDGARRRRLGTPAPADAHAHRAARAVRRDLERVGQVPVTGGNMEPLEARMDFEFDPLPEGFGPRVERARQRRARRRPPDRGVVPAARDRGRGRGPHPHEGEHDPRVGDARSASSTSSASTSRPTAARTCSSTGEVGRIRVVKTESKGKGNKRIRLEIVDA